MQVPVVFQYEEQNVRTVMVEDDAWFVAVDVCRHLGISQVARALDRLEIDEVGLVRVTHPQSPTKEIEINAINESGLYTLILRSDKPEAKKFRKWVTSEVLPTLRKQGSYSVETPEMQMAKGLLAAQILIEEKQKQIEVMEPKALAFDMFMSAKNNMTMGEAAKALGWGRNALFKFLRLDGILMQDNEPYQKYIDAGYFTVRRVTVQMGEDRTETKPQTLVTPKGLNWLAKQNIDHMKARKRLIDAGAI